MDFYQMFKAGKAQVYLITLMMIAAFLLLLSFYYCIVPAGLLEKLTGTLNGIAPSLMVLILPVHFLL